MRVLFDHSVFTLQTRGGISRYFCELARNLQKDPECSPRILAPCHRSALLREMKGLPVMGKYLPPVSHTHRLRQWINNGLSTLTLPFMRPDLVHATYYLAKIRIPAGTPLVVTVFDMIHERFPDNLPPGEQNIARAKRRCVQQADHIICISRQTKKDLVDIIGLDERKISVIYLGCSFPLAGHKDPKPLVVEPYFFYVGNRGGVKNFKLLVDALAQASSLTGAFRLVCFGGGPFTAGELRYIRERGLPVEMFVQTGGNDLVLENLYRHATALVYPSLYEGFGLPVLEAMACDCPVICSDCSSLPEVAGQAALLFDPHSPDALRNCMEQVAGSVAKREHLILAGRQQCCRFSWSRCAGETMRVYRQCLEMN